MNKQTSKQNIQECAQDFEGKLEILTHYPKFFLHRRIYTHVEQTDTTEKIFGFDIGITHR